VFSADNAMLSVDKIVSSADNKMLSSDKIVSSSDNMVLSGDTKITYYQLFYLENFTHSSGKQDRLKFYLLYVQELKRVSKHLFLSI
jgi:hypothetical protein